MICENFSSSFFFCLPVRLSVCLSLFISFPRPCVCPSVCLSVRLGHSMAHLYHYYYFVGSRSERGADILILILKEMEIFFLLSMPDENIHWSNKKYLKSDCPAIRISPTWYLRTFLMSPCLERVLISDGLQFCCALPK